MNKLPLLIILVLLAGVSGVSAACTSTISVVSSDIYVYGTGTANLTCISAEVANESLLNETSAGNWLLSTDLIQNETGSTLEITSADVTWLKMKSDQTGSRDSDLRIDRGGFLINNTKITSWNTSSGAFHDYGGSGERARIIVGLNTYAGSGGQILNSNLSYLGDNAESFGVVFYKNVNNSNVTNNTFIRNAYGFAIRYDSYNNLVSDNTIDNATWDGIALRNDNCDNNTIRNNTVSNVGRYAISLFNAYNNTVENNTIDASTASSKIAIYLEDATTNNTLQHNKITNGRIRIDSADADYNQIINNTITGTIGNWAGIQLYADGEQLVDNNISNTDNNGIIIWNGANNYNISNNNINDNSQRGIYLYINGNDTSTVRNNTITGNNWGIYIRQSNNWIFESNDVSGSSTSDYFVEATGTSLNNTVRDAISSFTISSQADSDFHVEFTSGNVFTTNGGDTPYWFSDKSNLTIEETASITITRFDSTLTVTAGNNVTVTAFSTSGMTLDYYNANISYVNFTLADSASNLNITLNNVATGLNLSLYYANGTLIDNQVAASTIYFNDSLSDGSYYIQVQGVADTTAGLFFYGIITTVFSDGSYLQNLSVAGKTQANMTIVPSSENITVEIYNWTATYKKWNESADNTSVTVTHTICDNRETSKMRLKILNTPSGKIYRYKNTNGDGCFTYTYTLGYANGTVTYILTQRGGPNLAVAATGGTGVGLLILYLYRLRRRRR